MGRRVGEGHGWGVKYGKGDRGLVKRVDRWGGGGVERIKGAGGEVEQVCHVDGQVVQVKGSVESTCRRGHRGPLEILGLSHPLVTSARWGQTSRGLCSSLFTLFLFHLLVFFSSYWKVD